MARIGFKKSYPAGTFDEVLQQDLFDQLKLHLIAADFKVLLDTPTAIDFIQAGAALNAAHDDVPHWGLELFDDGGDFLFTPYAVYGTTLDDPSVRRKQDQVGNWNVAPARATNGITFWFAADGAAGWWWLYSEEQFDTGLQTNYVLGATCRRYPADCYQGLSTRYGLLCNGTFSPAYVTDATTGDSANNITFGLWSPLNGDYLRHAASPLPRLAVPCFPSGGGNNATAHLFGEFNELLHLTSGYATEDTPLPGWIALDTTGWQPFAFPAPETFSLLP